MFGPSVRLAFSPLRRGLWAVCCPAGTGFRPPAEFGTPVRRAARWGRLWGCARQSDTKHRVAGLGHQRRYNRRVERHGYQSLTARQSRDLLLISGRVDCVNTPPPLHPPRNTPLSFQLPQNGEGNAAIAAGASLPHYARSGDLPPRRINARVRLRSGCESASANSHSRNWQLKNPPPLLCPPLSCHLSQRAQPTRLFFARAFW